MVLDRVSQFTMVERKLERTQRKLFWNLNQWEMVGFLIGKERCRVHYTSVSVDEIKFYNRQLSQEEIGNMYRRL